jgi:hypothetical protein
MTRLASWLAILAVVIGALLLRLSFVYGCDGNYAPSRLPFPGHGLTATDAFDLPGNGWFTLEVITPARDAEKALLHREQPPISCSLTVVITGPNAFTLRRAIDHLDNAGWTRDSNIYLPGDRFRLPFSGEYRISLTNNGYVNTFSDRGALVQLTRFEPTGPEVFYPIARSASYACFLVAIICSLFVIYHRPNLR